MIDIHTHIIPDLDDGPPDMETSVDMGRIATEDGIATIISTSHSDEASAVGREGMLARLDEVRAAWKAAGLDIRLEPGVEIFLTPGTARDLKEGTLWPLAGSRYVLVEVPYAPWPAYADDALFDLQMAGYVPILAHPERYHPIQNDPNRMYALAERGILSQVTALALLGEHGAKTKQCAEALVRYGLAQFISSDAHGLTLRKRVPRLSEARQTAESLVGAEIARALVLDNPQAVLANRVIVPQPEQVSPRKWTFGGLFGRN